MSEKKSSGCLLMVFGGVVLVFLVVGGGVFWLFSAKKESMQMARDTRERMFAEQIALTSTSNDREEMVDLKLADIGSFSPGNFGSSLTREHFVAFMADQKSTELARKTFTERANGEQVKWLLKTAEVRQSADSDRLEGKFTLPYRIQTSRNGSTGSSLQIQAEFPTSERDRLIELRRDTWVHVEGKLAFDQSATRLLDARIVTRGTAEKVD